MILKFTTFSLFFVVFSMVRVIAQTDTLPSELINEVVVTANYKPTGIDKSINPIRILNIDKLQTVGVQNVADALKFQGNFNIVQDNINGTQTSVQGLSGNNIKILIDGRPIIGRLNGNIDLAQISLLNIERLEIVEGPLSAQYGTNALGGTINIITKKNFDKDVEVLASGYAESVGKINAGVVGNFRLNDRDQINITGGRNYFGGWSSVDTSRFQDWKPKIQYNTSVRFSRDAGKNATQQISDKLSFSVDGNYSNEYLLNRGAPILPYGENAFDDHYTTERWSTGINATYDINKKSKIDFQTGYSFYKRTKNSFYRDLVNLSESLVATPGSQDTTRYDYKMLRLVYSNSVNNAFGFESGIDFYQETATGLRIRTNNNLIGDYAAFASAEWKIIDNGEQNSLSIKPALRVTANSIYKIPLIADVNLKWNFAPEWTARGSWGRGFRSPDLKELYFYFVDINHNIVGNPDLKPEDSQNFLASLHFKKVQTSTAYKAELGGFYNDVINLITLIPTNLNSTAYTYINVGRYKTVGARLTGEITVKNWTFSTGLFFTNRNYYFTDTLNTDTLLIGNSIDANAQVFYTLKPLGITLNFWIKHTDRFNFFSQNSKGKVIPSHISPYDLADFGASKNFLNRKITATIGVKNIFDVRNVESQIAATGLGVHNASDGGTSIATGRNFFVKFDIHL